MATDSAKISKPFSVRFEQWAQRVALGRKFAIGLTVAALASSLATYAVLAGWAPLKTDIKTMLILLNLDLVLFLILGAVVARGLVRVWMERRRGAVGSRLHTRFVLLFSLVAVTPTVIIAISSAIFFSLGLEAWFSERVRTALNESDAVAEAYLKEHQQTIRGDILAMARDISRAAPLLANDANRFRRMIATQGTLRSLSEAAVFDSSGHSVVRWNNLGFSLFDDTVPAWAFEQAREGEPVMINGEADDRIRALVKLDRFVDIFLYVSRFVEPGILLHVERTRRAVKQYEELEGKRSEIEITFAMMFVLVALLLLMAAIWIGLIFATRLVRPISDLVIAAEHVRSGDLTARLDEGGETDEIGTLNRAFNRMTEQLGTQHDGLLEANRQLDERRHFIETVLAGVSSGVIGLDAYGHVNVANRAAMALLSAESDEVIGQRLDTLIPECEDLLRQATNKPDQAVDGQIVLRRKAVSQTLFVRLSPEGDAGEHKGYVATFEDITELLSAQRKAAWSDVARRIAHEIKNPLTPIQLAAERLRRKYLEEITSDPKTFAACTDTIIRHVGDIGRLVDEFSSFARMPAPVMKPENLNEICLASLVLFENAHREIKFRNNLSSGPVDVACDYRQVGQALTNLLQNAVDAIEGRQSRAKESDVPGDVELEVTSEEGYTIVSVSDNGIGLPSSERDRLTEPYVTTREKGTGLGLAIVRKIMEDHGGSIRLEDNDNGGARVSLVFSTHVDNKIDQVKGHDKAPKRIVTHGA
jgi:two-component system nitrogen regulation sensor histidine kinase NtrY